MESDLFSAEGKRMPVELIRKTPVLEVDALLSKALSLLRSNPAVIVNRAGSYYGIVDSRSIYRLRGGLKISGGQTVGKYAVSTPIMNKDSSLDDVIMAFHESRSKALPFMSNNRVVGVIDRNTILKVLLSMKMLEGAKVESAMTSPAIGVSEGTALEQARAVMENNGINRLLVVRNGKLTGLLTYFSLLQGGKTIDERLPLMKMRTRGTKDVDISEIAEKSPKTVAPDYGLADAARVLIENNISSLVVVDGKAAPVGVLTATDIIENVIARRRLEENRIFISGLDEVTREYEDDIRSELRELVDRIEKMKNSRVDYLAMHLRRFRRNEYDIKLRVSVSGVGIVSAQVTGFLLDKTFEDALSVLKKNVIRERERKRTARKGLMTVSE